MANTGTSAHPETKPFLQLEEDTEARRSDIWNDEEDLSRRHGGSRPSRLQRTPLWLHLILLLLNVILAVWNGRAATKTLGITHDANIEAGEGFILSPAEMIIHDFVEDYVPSSPMSSPFTGEWRPEVDEAWSKLLQPSTIRLSEEEMRAMNKTSVVLKDGSGYVGYLETFHMLHCVKRFYQFGNRENYPDVQAMDGFNPAHIGETSSSRRPCLTMF
ncbi:hypothetical protein J7T55_001721 [Diaporthe amygdali]|uniref:uncharacterized protein n=1 Tax=Phomopsis amygdali TaxID=1214568 RepID=UPI0022FE60EA|nr:uncharacterized protein J7T55_001721 [Diaporthe amygdali]KAJ0104234.1 hypothetical protein J7T55_001721 [Diaporthe amygdali]